MKPKRRQGGQGAPEFLLAAPVVLLLGLGCIEASHWFFVRQAVSQALMQAGRTAIAHHADPTVLDTAFARALLPLFAAPTAAEGRRRLESAMARREQATSLPAWRIMIQSPSAASFEDFSSSRRDLPNFGRAVIDNDYLGLQHEARLAQGWPQGRGPRSQQTTLEANTLVLNLAWLHEPLLPGLRQLMKFLAPPDSRYGSLAMARAGYLPLRRQVSLVMQSHPVAWPLPGHGRVVREGERDTLNAGGTEPIAASPDALRPCIGLWCGRVSRTDPFPGSGEGAAPPGHGPAPGAVQPRPAADGGGSARDEGRQQGAGAGSTDAPHGSDASGEKPDDAGNVGETDCPGCCD